MVVCLSAICLVIYLAAVTNGSASNFAENFLRTHDLGFLNEFDDGRPYRLFLKSYILVLLVFVLSAYRILLRRGDRWDHAACYLAAVVLWNSYTRSIWGLIPVMLVVIAILHWRRGCVKFLLPLGGIAILAVSSFIAAGLSQKIRIDDRDGTAAMRFGQAELLAASFLESPICGAGFGSPVDANTGFSIELDLLNLLRKIGIIGLALYVAAFAMPILSARRQWFETAGCPEPVAMFAIGMVAVFGMGAVNPYATASLGVGAMCIALVYLSASAAEPQRFSSFTKHRKLQ
jgi:O-antigen ligase